MQQINIYFVGPMGAGKTTIGRRVAELLGYEFLDLDHEIEEQTGASVSLVFEIEGEAGFRLRETKALRDLCDRTGILLATGGGVILREENRDVLSRTGFVVYLKTSVDQQIRRLRQDKQRPLLQTPNRRKKLKEMAELRNPLYEDVADITVETGGRSMHVAAKRIAASIEEALKPSC